MAGQFVLPQYQGSLYDIQRQQALANALMQSALTSQPQAHTVGSGGSQNYQVMPKTSWAVPLGQIVQGALSAKMGKDAGQSMNQLGRDQYNALTGGAGIGALSNALGNLSGGNASPLQSAPAGQPVDDGSAGAGGVSQQLSQPQQQPQQGALTPGGALNPLGMPVQQAAMMLFSNPDKYWEVQAGAYKPTDATLMARAGGVDTAQANRDALFHANYVAPNQGAPGTIARDPRTNQPLYYSPDIPKGGEPLFNAGGQVIGVKQLDGSLKLIGDAAAAQAGGEGSVLPYSGVDGSGRPMPVTNRTQAARGYVGNQPPPLPTQPGLTGNAAMSNASDVPLPGGAAPGGAIYAAPPMGATTAADAAQGAPSKQMADSYASLSNSDANYQQSRQALTEMMSLANKKGLGGAVVGVMPDTVGTKLSPDAAKYSKAQAAYIGLQGKALGAGATDAARANIENAVPGYDKPQSAMVSGLQDQLNNIDRSHLKTQFLTPLYQQGNEKAFTQQSAAFDQNIKPAMVPIMQLSGEAQRSAVKAAIAKDPSLQANFKWAWSNGFLK